MGILEMWFHSIPLLKVSAIYLAVLLPTFLILRKTKPFFWWIYSFLTIELLVINGIFYWLLFESGFEKGWEKFLELIFFGAPIAVFLFLVFPLLSKNYIINKEKKLRFIIISYLFSFISIYLIGFGLYYLIALSINAWFEYFN